MSESTTDRVLLAEELTHKTDILDILWKNDIRWLVGEIRRLRRWVNDLQAGGYINCLYCGHRYGSDDEVEATMQQALYDHIAECPKHPLSKERAENDRLRSAIQKVLDDEESRPGAWGPDVTCVGVLKDALAPSQQEAAT